jgi:hypothetical protein
LWYQKAVRLAFASLVAFALLSSAACSSQTGDPPASNGVPAVGGKELRIRELVNPALEGHQGRVGTTQAVSGAVVIAVDSFDETQNGRGVGNIFVQDIGATKDTPYAGINLFAPSFNPGNLRVSPGDVLDMRGEYQENTRIPSSPPVIFAPGAVLSQLAQPISTFRYETRIPDPVDIDLADLTDFTKGRQWLGMLVRVQNVTAARDVFVQASGRTSLDLTPLAPNADTKCEGAFPKPVQLVNDLMDLTPLNLKQGSKIKSIIGVVGFFCSIKLAPRSMADIQL